MSFIYMPQSRAVSIVADKEQASFPASFTLTDHPKQTWKSTDGTGVLTLQADLLTSGLYVTGCNAESVKVEVDDSSQVASQTFDLSGITTLEEFMTGEAVRRATGFWFNYGSLVPLSSTVTLTFTKAFVDNVPVECGLIWPGLQERTEHSPSMDMNDSYKDYSLIEEDAFNNGAAYILPGESARRVELALSGTREEIDLHYHRFRHLVGPRPMPVLLSDELSGDWHMFARFESEPQRKYVPPFRAEISGTLIERL